MVRLSPCLRMNVSDTPLVKVIEPEAVVPSALVRLVVKDFVMLFAAVPAQEVPVRVTVKVKSLFWSPRLPETVLLTVRLPSL